jgi:hypothetical protein
MTFEARDSAAKVVPARFKLSSNGRTRSGGVGSRRTTTSKHIFRKNKFIPFSTHHMLSFHYDFAAKSFIFSCA